MADPQSAPPPSSPPLLLDLNTLSARPTVRIDGTAYELRHPDELSILEYHRLMTAAKRMDALEQIDEPTEGDVAEYERVTHGFCTRVLVAPPEVIGRLTAQQKALVGMAFTGLRLSTALGTAGARDQASHGETTGASGSPA